MFGTIGSMECPVCGCIADTQLWWKMGKSGKMMCRDYAEKSYIVKKKRSEMNSAEKEIDDKEKQIKEIEATLQANYELSDKHQEIIYDLEDKEKFLKKRIARVRKEKSDLVLSEMVRKSQIKARQKAKKFYCEKI